MRNRIKKAFTLVEILIVVVILGILAAIVVPQFTNATEDAQEGNMRAQLKSLQNQLELYKARTNAYPDLVANGWADLLDPDGNPATDDGYIKDEPKNPRNGSSTIAAAAGAAVGFTWDAATGDLGMSYFDEATQEITDTP